MPAVLADRVHERRQGAKRHSKELTTRGAMEVAQRGDPGPGGMGFFILKYIV
jgi:hypothetical protein